MALSAEDIASMLKETSQRLLELQGVDATASPLKEALELAWRDFNPERALRFCSYLAVENEPTQLGVAVGIPSLGTKVLFCEKLQQGGRANSLDEGMEQFKKRLGCEQCPHRSPRPNDWKWDWTKA